MRLAIEQSVDASFRQPNSLLLDRTPSSCRCAPFYDIVVYRIHILAGRCHSHSFDLKQHIVETLRYVMLPTCGDLL